MPLTSSLIRRSIINSRTLVPILALLLVGCREQQREPARTPVTQPAPSPPVTQQPPATPAERFFALVPDSIKIRRGACPFECCTYREWVAREAIPVFARERDSTSVRAHIAKGERFQALTGNVHILSAAIIAVAQRLPIYPDTALLPGDTVVLLDHTGEGYYNVWTRDGHVYNVEGNWTPSSQHTRNQRMGETIAEWWVHVKRKDGTEGWINANISQFGNADRCGLPE